MTMHDDFSTPTSPGGGRWDVLVVDDEAVVRDGVRKVLETEGLRVAVAADVEAALEHAAAADCRLVLCDLVLPGRSGIDLIRALRKRRPDVPVVLITGYATAEQISLARQAGATDFLAKPFDESELRESVNGALATGRTAG